jgi:hypothetical protein
VWNYRASYWRRLFFNRPVVCGEEQAQSLVVLMGLSARYIYSEKTYMDLSWAALNLYEEGDEDEPMSGPPKTGGLNLWGSISLVSPHTPRPSPEQFEFLLDDKSIALLKSHSFSTRDFLGFI